MWKQAASIAAIAAASGPVAVAIADESPAIEHGATAGASRGHAGVSEERARDAHKRRAHRGIAARQHRRAKRRRQRGARRVPPALQAITACESGGNPCAIGGGGLYRGKYQMTRETWASVGGSGDPADAPEAEQDRRAAILYARAGASQWPACGA
jgi:hypothetical protein